MRFFTMAWWSGEDDSNDAPINAYAEHLAQIGDRLPPDLRATQESISLHDSRLRELHLSVESGSLQIVLENYDGEPPLTLLYSQVSRFESVTSLNRLSGPAGYGDLGYEEVDILPNGLFEHRLLFSTGIELIIEFRDFQLVR